MAANLGFLGLFIWLYRLRADVLILQERLAERRGTYEPA
jgi:heme exporter protein C